MAPWRTVCVVVAAASLLMCAFLFNASLQSYGKSEAAWSVVLGLGCAVMLWITFISTDISLLHPSESHTLKTLIHQYFYIRKISIVGKLCYLYFQTYPKKTVSIQEKVLNDILLRSRDSIYGKKYKFADIKSPLDYIQRHPLTKYDHYEEYIDMIAEQGQKHVLSGGEVTFLGMSSGTTGKSKKLPIDMPALLKSARVSTLAVTYQLAQNTSMDLRRIFLLKCMSPEFKTKSGHRFGMVGSLSHQHLPHNVIPRATVEIKTLNESFYVHAVFALAEKDLGTLNLFMANLAYNFVKYIEEHWTEMCEDIEFGRLNLNVRVEDDVRSEINKKLKPNPTRAMELRQEFSCGFDNIIKRMWPNCKGVICICTGAFSMYRALLSKYLGSVPTYNRAYASTEGIFGMCLNNGDDYVLCPTTNFYEFIPVERMHEEQPPTLLCHQVEIGEEYELVITSPQGWYRYRVGDVLKVVEKLQDKLPVLEFAFRSGQMLNIAFERTPESVFYKAIDQTNSEWGDVLLDYTTTESAVLEEIVGHSLPKCYVVFVEASKQLSDEQKSLLEVNLCSIFEFYRMKRSGGGIEPMKVIQMKRGCFERLKAAMIEKTQSCQFKLPRVLRKEEYLKMLLKELFNTENLF